MREYGKVYTSFWSDPTIRAMSEDARALALYLLTCQHGNSIGLFRLPDAYAADDLQWPIERVSKAFQNLIDSRFLVRETASNWLVIPKYTKWNGFENPKVAIGAMKVLESCPDGDAKRLCAQSILQYGAHLTAEFRNRLDTLSKEYRNKEPSQSLARAKPEPEPEPEPSQSRSGVPAAPPRPAERPASKTDATWKAYSAAYLRTYGAEPVRNAKVNGQLANVVDRIGGDDAPLCRRVVRASPQAVVRREGAQRRMPAEGLRAVANRMGHRPAVDEHGGPASRPNPNHCRRVRRTLRRGCSGAGGQPCDGLIRG